MEPPEYEETPGVSIPESVPATPQLSRQHSAPVTLTWTPPEVTASTENPPGYASASIPTRPVVYTFSPLSFNSMILIPPADAQDSRPKYHFSVSFNCFLPSCHITTIRRGGLETGEHVADLEGGNAAKGDMIRMHGQESTTMLLIKQQRGQDRRYPYVFTWQSSVTRRLLLWQGDGNKWTCTLRTHPYPLLARLELPPGSMMKPRRLEVTPDGHGRGEREGIFDEIIVSALLLERKRLKGDGWK